MDWDEVLVRFIVSLAGRRLHINPYDLLERFSSSTFQFRHFLCIIEVTNFTVGDISSCAMSRCRFFLLYM